MLDHRESSGRFWSHNCLGKAVPGARGGLVRRPEAGRSWGLPKGLSSAQAYLTYCRTAL